MADSDSVRQAAPAGNGLQGVRRLIDLRIYSQALGQCRLLLQSNPDATELHQLAGISALAIEDLNDPEDADTLYHLSRLW